MCPYAVQKDARQMIFCQKTAGVCGHIYLCQLSNRYKLTRGAENCAMARKTAPASVPAEAPAEEKKIEKAVAKSATTRRKARAKE